MQKIPDRPDWAPLLINWNETTQWTRSSSSSSLSLVASSARFNDTCKLVLEVSVSHGDSAISHPRDQDYLSLWVGKGSEVELQQALEYMLANLRKWEREEKQSTVVN